MSVFDKWKWIKRNWIYIIEEAYTLDLVDLFKIKKETKSLFLLPEQDCEVIEQHYEERLKDLKDTNKDDLLVFQTNKQIQRLPYDEFVDFKRWIYEWLQEFC